MKRAKDIKKPDNYYVAIVTLSMASKPVEFTVTPEVREGWLKGPGTKAHRLAFELLAKQAKRMLGVPAGAYVDEDKGNLAVHFELRDPKNYTADSEAVASAEVQKPTLSQSSLF